MNRRSALTFAAALAVLAGCALEPDLRTGGAGLRNCEWVAPDHAAVGVADFVGPPAPRESCRWSVVVDIQSIASAAIRVTHGAAATSPAACTQLQLASDLYVHDGGRYRLVSAAEAARRGVWNGTSCEVPSFVFEGLTAGADYRVVGWVRPDDAPVRVTTESAPGAVADAGPPGAALPLGSPGSDELRIRAAEPNNVPVPDRVGAFRVECPYSHMNSDDPIVYPGQPGRAHLHTYFGNTGTDAYSTYESLATTGRSTCSGGIANRSAYWIPSLLHDGAPLAPSRAIFYYKSGYSIPGVSSDIQRFPSGLRMIAGDGAATDAQQGAAVSWGCRDSYVGHHASIYDCPVGDGLKASVFFPQCWNGVDVDSPDHRSHMAYAVGGACPPSHPIVLPQLSMQVTWDRTADLDIGALRLSSDAYRPGLPGGYSLHADYFEGWMPEVMDAFVEHCINPSLDCHANLLGDGRRLY